MGIELPPELADVAAQTGVKWPEADEDKMRETAQAWRDTGKKIDALISEADSTARTALSATEGESADAARRHWGTFVQPDTGKLTSMSRGCTKAADQLDHAATQVADAKLAIVRNLVPLARNKDVAEHAAAAGHPTALLGLDTAIKGTAANIANVHATLVHAVQPVTGATVDAVQPLVNTNPGAHGPGLNLGGHGQSLVSDVVQPLAETGKHGQGQGLVPGLVNQVAQPVVDAAGQVLPGGQGQGQGQGLVPGLVNQVGDVAQPVVDTATGKYGQGLVADAAGQVLPGSHGQGHGQGLVPGVVQPVADAVTGGGHHPGLVPGVVHPVADAVTGGPGQHGFEPGHRFPGGPEPATGPIPVADRPGNNLPPDAPTPPGGFHRPDHAVQAASAAVLDAPPPPVQQTPAAPPPVNQPVAPAPGQFAPGGPPAPPTAAPPVGAQPIPGQPQPGGPPVQRGPAPVVLSAEPPRQGPMVGVGAPPPPQQQPQAQAQAHATEEPEPAIALWLVRMFPIGHMPVAADRPARQLPPPSPEFDYAAGMRFEPNDHPAADLIDDTVALNRTDRVVAGPPQEHNLAEGHDPLAGENERDWDRRFVVRAGSGRDTLDTEYAWPPSELFPEGATAPGEPEVLEPGTVIDRFGTPEGRVFAADGTPFTRRSLPPSHVNAEYRRYRVLKPLPVWRGISAAWFGQNGGGVRFRTVLPALDLVALGYLAEERDEG